jgi:hypothetical protein
MNVTPPGSTPHTAVSWNPLAEGGSETADSWPDTDEGAVGAEVVWSCVPDVPPHAAIRTARANVGIPLRTDQTLPVELLHNEGLAMAPGQRPLWAIRTGTWVVLDAIRLCLDLSEKVNHLPTGDARDEN